MNERFDILAYIEYLRRRWKLCAATCLVAATVSGAVSMLLPSQYTAVATLLIDAPPGADPRVATAVSPMYLESLKTYERFAASDTVFANAVEHFRLREVYGGVPIQSLKARVLKVNKPRDTMILVIGVTLRDPVKAQACSQYIAEETLNLNRSIARASDREPIDDAKRELETAKRRLDEMETAVRKQSAEQPVEGLDLNLDDVFETQERLRRQLIALRLDAAEAAARNQRDESRALEARAQALQAQLAAINSDVAQKQSTLSQRRTRREELTTRLDVARAAFEAANKRVTELESSLGNRTERLRMLDPGIVPQRPSSPNVPLNIVAATLLTFVCCWFYLTITFHFADKRQARLMPVRAYAAER